MRRIFVCQKRLVDILTSLVEVERYELWNGEERGIMWIVEL